MKLTVEQLKKMLENFDNDKVLGIDMWTLADVDDTINNLEDGQFNEEGEPYDFNLSVEERAVAFEKFVGEIDSNKGLTWESLENIVTEMVVEKGVTIN